MKRGFIAWILIGICLVVLLRGGMNIEEQAFVVTIGIDLEDSGEISLALEIPSAQASASGASNPSDGSATSNGYELISCTAPNILDAIDLLDSSIPRVINCSQVLMVVVSEALASQPMFYETIEGLSAFHNFRQSAELVICSGKAREFTEKQQPFLGIRLSANIRTSLKVYGQKGDIPRASVGEALRYINGGWRDMLMPYAAVTGSGEQIEAVEGRPLDIVAGEVPYYGNEEIEFLGAAVFSGARMVGLLTGMEMQFLSFVLGEMQQFTFAIDGSYYIMNPVLSPYTSVDTGGDPWKLRVSGTVQANALGNDNTDYAQVEDAFAQEVLSVLRKLQEMGVDPVGFEGKAIRAHGGGLIGWASIPWDDKYRDATVEAQITVRIGEAP